MDPREPTGRALLQGGGAAAAELATAGRPDLTPACPAQPGHEVLPWLDQPAANPSTAPAAEARRARGARSAGGDTIPSGQGRRLGRRGPGRGMGPWRASRRPSMSARTLPPASTFAVQATSHLVSASVVHTLRATAIGHVNEHVNGIVDGHGPACSQGGERNTRRFALSAVVVDELALLYRFEHDLPVSASVKMLLANPRCSALGQTAVGASAAKAERRVVERGIPASQAATRTRRPRGRSSSPPRGRGTCAARRCAPARPTR
jgi:hypothetical protein